MKASKRKYYLLAFGLIFTLTFFSCRKKDERYEGYYSGTERYTYLDSGATVNSIDSTYLQEVEITYDKVTGSNKKAYTVIRIFNNPGTQIFQFTRKSFVEHEYISESGSLKFSGDSMYMTMSNASDYNQIWDIELWEFKGKRN